MHASARVPLLAGFLLLLASALATDAPIEGSEVGVGRTPGAPGNRHPVADPRGELLAAAGGPRLAPGPQDARPSGGRAPSWRERGEPPAEDEEYTNLDRASLGGAFFDPRDLDALQAIIDINGLTEFASPDDFDDGDGVLHPLELGFQVWRGGRLRALHSGPDRYGSFDYHIAVLPEAVGELQGLEVLDLHATGLSSLPDELATIPGLRELRIPGNELRELPESVGSMRSLERLQVNGNALTALPASIGGLRRLEEIHAGHNPLETLPATLLELPELRVLNVSATDALSDPDAADTIGNLHELPEGIEEMPRLEMLIVSGNRLYCDGGVPASLRSNGRIQVFGAGHQRCRVKGPQLR